MRRRGGVGGGPNREWPTFPIGPILVNYGGEEPVEGTGSRPYRCPFHGDSNASATVNEVEGWFNCHAADCPRGNAVQIIMKAENLDYQSAVERATSIAGEAHASVQSEYPIRRRVAKGKGNQSGGRRFVRTWRS